jgi:acyl carrier protein phosphodiesterase
LLRGGFLFLGVNYLAHIYLSGSNEDVMLGNFMADSIKGKQHQNYPEGIQKGILLHRFIDDFTDTHPVVLETKILFRPIYHKLSPILVDMVYDHFLAKNWQTHHHQPLREFVNATYATLQNRQTELPERIRHMLPYMVQYDWLYNYQFKEGMERVLLGMSKRVPNGEVLKNGWRDLVPVYTEVEQQFETFFGAMKTALREKE